MAQRVGRGIALLLHDRGTRRGEWSAARSGRTLPQGKSRYPFYRRLGGPQSRSGQVRKSRPHVDSIPGCPAHSQSLYRLSSFSLSLYIYIYIYVCVCVCVCVVCVCVCVNLRVVKE